MTRRGPLLLALVLLSAGLAAAPPAAAAEPLGALTVTGTGDGSCPAGHACTRFTVSCPGVSVDRDGFYAVSPSPAGTPRGVIVFFSGGSGTLYWGPDDPAEAALVERLHTQHGYVVVQVRWQGNWQAAPSGQAAGLPAVSCRPATVIEHLYDAVFLPLGLAVTPGICGFCVTGTSGGSAQAAYAISHFGLDDVLQGVFPVSGPTHAAISEGCRRDVREEDLYWYPNGASIDEAYGFLTKNGPCFKHDPSWDPTWEADAVDAPGADHLHPGTRVHLILGEADIPQRTRGEDYVRTLTDGGSPYVEVSLVDDMGHALNAGGIAALEDALTWAPNHARAACANGLDDDGDGAADWPGDGGCTAAADASERRAGGPACDDGADQDGDGRRDAPRDSGCASPTDTNERSSAPCDNGLDDDLDGDADFPDDLGCTSIADTAGTGSAERSNAYACDNGLDDDGDGAIDHREDGAGDPQCVAPTTATEGGGGGGGSTLSIGNRDVTEGNPGSTASCRINVTIAPTSTTQVTVHYETADGTATAPADYTARSGTASIRPGKSKRVIKIPITGDALAEPSETFYVDLSNPRNAQLGNSRGTCTIANDD
jgi:Calx-beta domain-containing protein